MRSCNFSLAIKVVFLSFSLLFTGSGSAGQCDYPDDRARDGSRCGDRAASVRPGGRNPDTDWIFWTIGIGVVAWIFFSRSGTESGSSRTSHTPSRRQLKPPPQSTRYVHQPRPESVNQNTKQTGGQVTIPFETRARNILKSVFDVDVEPMFEPVFQGVIKQVEENGGNIFDAATHYMLTQIGSFEGIPGANIDAYVDTHTQNIMSIVDKLSIEPESMPYALNLMRTMRNLKPL